MEPREKTTKLREYTELPDNLTVEGNLNLSCTNIKALPDNLTVGGYLDLSHTDITELQDGLTVGGGLDLSCTDIRVLPDGLTVGGYLDLSHTYIRVLPDNLTVGGYLDLSHTYITELQDNLTVGGPLFFSDTNIRSNSNYFISNRIGSRSAKTVFFIKKNVIKCGCFSGTLEQFITKVNETYGVGSKHGIEYDEFINKCKKII